MQSKKSLKTPSRLGSRCPRLRGIGGEIEAPIRNPQLINVYNPVYRRALPGLPSAPQNPAPASPECQYVAVVYTQRLALRSKAVGAAATQESRSARAGLTEPSRGRVWVDNAPLLITGERWFHPLGLPKQMQPFKHYVMETNVGAAVLSR